MREGMYAIHKSQITSSHLNTIAFSYLPVYTPIQIDANTGTQIYEGKLLTSLEDAIEMLNAMISSEDSSFFLSMEGISEISEEEYYKIE